jgi:hypothetical protein
MKTPLRLLTAFFISITAGCAAQTPAPVRHAMAASQVRAASTTPLLLISLDGFRADYLRRGLSPTLQMLADDGVRARAMEPSFPSLTFPNHYTLVTGKYPDDNGIVNNDMFDSKLGTFRLNLRKAVSDGRWWDEAEPIWVDADRHGLPTAIMFWPGSEASIHGFRPDHWRPYNGKMPYDQRVDQILAWLDLPPAQRPHFLALYFQRVDTAGHYYGPDSPETNQAIRDVDAALARLVAGLKKRGMYAHINLIVLADHGIPPGTGRCPAQPTCAHDLLEEVADPRAPALRPQPARPAAGVLGQGGLADREQPQQPAAQQETAVGRARLRQRRATDACPVPGPRPIIPKAPGGTGISQCGCLPADDPLARHSRATQRRPFQRGKGHAQAGQPLRLAVAIHDHRDTAVRAAPPHAACEMSALRTGGSFPHVVDARIAATVSVTPDRLIQVYRQRTPCGTQLRAHPVVG